MSYIERLVNQHEVVALPYNEVHADLIRHGQPLVYGTRTSLLDPTNGYSQVIGYAYGIKTRIEQYLQRGYEVMYKIVTSPYDRTKETGSIIHKVINQEFHDSRRLWLLDCEEDMKLSADNTLGPIMSTLPRAEWGSAVKFWRDPTNHKALIALGVRTPEEVGRGVSNSMQRHILQMRSQEGRIVLMTFVGHEVSKIGVMKGIDPRYQEPVGFIDPLSHYVASDGTSWFSSKEHRYGYNYFMDQELYKIDSSMNHLTHTH